MADEAVVRIVLDAPAATDPQAEARALKYGEAMPWAPPGKPIQAPEVPGLGRTTAEYLRMEAEAARAGVSVSEWKRAEVEAERVATVGPPEPSFEERRAERQRLRATQQAAEGVEVARREEELRQQERYSEEQARLSFAESPPDQPVAPAQSPPLPPPPPPAQFDPVEVAQDRVDAEKKWVAAGAEYAKIDPRPARSALDAMLEALEGVRGTVGAVGGSLGRVAAVALDVSAKARAARAARSAAMEREAPTAQVAPTKTPEEVRQLDAEIARREAQNPQPGSPMAKKLEELRGQKPVDAVPLTGEEASQLAAATSGATSKLAMMAPVVVLTTTAFKLAYDAVDSAAKRYAEYSPEIAQAQAFAELRLMLGDMRRAQENSKELSEFIRAQADMQNKFEDVKMGLMKKLIPVLTGVLETLSNLLGIASKRDVEGDDKDPTSILRNIGLDMPNF